MMAVDCGGRGVGVTGLFAMRVLLCGCEVRSESEERRRRAQLTLRAGG